MKVMGIPTCGTYKKAVRWLNDHDIAFETVDLRKTPPTKEELAQYHKWSKVPLKQFFNTSGRLYRDMELKEKRESLSDDDIYQLLADHPMLIKRPLIVDGTYVRTGFHAGEYEARWLFNDDVS